MKRLIILSTLAFLLVSSPAYAVKSVGFGVRGGYVSGYDNPDLMTYSGAIDRLQMLGAHLQVGFLPLLDLDLSGEYAWQSEKNFLPGVNLTYGDVSFNGTVSYSFSVPVVRPYVGLGLGVHRLVYMWDGAYAGALPDDQTKMSWHGLGGVNIGLPTFPMQIFFEARFSSLQTEPDRTNFTSLLAGVTFGL